MSLKTGNMVGKAYTIKVGNKGISDHRIRLSPASLEDIA
jgi:hypothetical protein